MREAKAEYYEALAGLKNADKAYREAEARYKDAETAYKNAEVAEQELKNAYWELVNAKKEADDEIAIAKAKAELEKTLVYWQTELTKQEEALAQAEFHLEQELRNIAAKSIGLNEQERWILNEAIKDYEQALTDYNATYRQLYAATRALFAKQYDVEAAIASLNETTSQDVEENTVNWAEDYEDSVAFYTLTKVAFEKKLAEYVLTDDPAVWAAELAEIQDSLDYWRYQANIVDADMSKKFANEYYDGVKAWNEAYAAYVKANEPEAPKGYDPNIIYFWNLYGQPVYEYALPQHIPSLDGFITLLNGYLGEYAAHNNVGEAKIENDVLSVEYLSIGNYEKFLNGDPKGKDSEWIGLNGIIETLERDLVLHGDTTTVAGYKKAMEEAKKAFEAADPIVRAGLFDYPPFADTLALAKEAYANMRQEAKAIADAQAAFVKEVVDYAQGLGEHSVLYSGNPISSYADSVALFNAIKNLAQARAAYFGEKIPAGANDYLYFYKYDGSFKEVNDSVALKDIVFSGFQQSEVRPGALTSPLVPVPSYVSNDSHYYAANMTFNSLYGGGVASPTPKGDQGTISKVFYQVNTVEMNRAGYDYTSTDAAAPQWWKDAYFVGQMVPATYAWNDAFVKAVTELSNRLLTPLDTYEATTKFWESIYLHKDDYLPSIASQIGIGGYKTFTDPTTKAVKVMNGDEEVVSQTVLDLGKKVMDNIDAFAEIYNAYWGADSKDLAREFAVWTKKGTPVTTPAKTTDEGWKALVTALVSGEIDGVNDTYGFYNWSVKTFTEPHNVLTFAQIDNYGKYPMNIKELRIILDNIGCKYVEGSIDNYPKYVVSKLFNSSECNQTLFAEMIDAQNLYEMYSHAKDALAIVEALKGVDEDIREAAEPKEEAVLAYEVAYAKYGQDYVTFYKTLTGDVKGADEVVEENTYPTWVDWATVVSVLKGRVDAVKAHEDYILKQIKDDQWTVKGEMKAMAEKYLPTYPADYHATQQLKGHSAEMIELYEGLYKALDKTYLTAVVMRDGKYTEGQLVTIPLPWGGEWSFVWGVWSFEQAYENVIKNCNDGIDLCERKIAYFERLIALEEAGFGEYEAKIMELQHEVERLTQKLADAQVKLDVAKAKYDEAIAAYAK